MVLLSSKTSGAPDIQTCKISLHALIKLSLSSGISDVVRTKTKHKKARRQAVLFRTRVEICHMNRHPSIVALISILHNCAICTLQNPFGRPSQLLKFADGSLEFCRTTLA